MNRAASFVLSTAAVGGCAGASAGCGVFDEITGMVGLGDSGSPRDVALGTIIEETAVKQFESVAEREIRKKFTVLYKDMFVSGGVWPIDANVPERAPKRSISVKAQKHPIVASGSGRVAALDGRRVSAWCEGFESHAQVQTNRYHCWAACAAMVLSYAEDAQAVSQDELIRAVKGEVYETDEGADDPRNMGNAYEVAKALNHELINGSDEFLVVSRAAMELAMTEDEGDLLTPEKARLLRRFLEQYMSAGEIVSAVASGEPVVVGLWNTENDAAFGAKDGTGHAMVIHKIEFSYVKKKNSADLRLAKLRLLTAYLEAYVNRDAGSDEDRALWGAKAAQILATMKKLTTVRSEFPTAVSIDKVHLVDPYDYSQNTETERLRTVLDGDELGYRLFFALSRPKAKAITPFSEGSDDHE